jgi:hypothetical protein
MSSDSTHLLVTAGGFEGVTELLAHVFAGRSKDATKLQTKMVLESFFICKTVLDI